MPETTRLFLLGGSPAYAVYGDEFVSAAGGAQAHIAVLVQTRAGWEKHQDEITQPWRERGVARFTVITPGPDGVLDQANAAAILRDATGIFIGGGHTPTYHRLFATEPMRTILRDKFYRGVPVAGISAGALIAMELCQLTPDETLKNESQIAPGLNLAGGFVIGVHYSERNALPEILEVMAMTQTRLGYGIDEPAGLLCENGSICRVLGKSVYQIEMSDFDNRVHRITPLNL
jgi:cyanophycinase